MLSKVAIFVLAATTAPLIAPVKSEESCIADWGAAGDIVRQQDLQTVEQLTSRAAAPLPGRIVKATLCHQNSGYIYRLVVRDSAGQLKNVVVDAAKQSKGQD
ncbi:MAG: hypothetical protein ABL907_10825 [Hyphomicrobium sp.]